MKNMIRTCILLLCIALSTSYAFKKDNIVKPICEYKTDPVGIDVMQPRLSWQIDTDRQNWKQSAYEIQTASSEADFEKGKNLLWSSGKTVSDQSVNVVYEGPKLEDMQRVY